MNKQFITDDFLLFSKTAKELYHTVAKDLPIIDYHCHLPADEIASDRKFGNMTRLWLNGDHYKWRAMRAAGVEEKYITGEAADWEKFLAWAKTVPLTLRNPLYHWTHMELKRPFGISNMLLSETTAEQIYNECNALLQTPRFTARGLIEQFNVRVICTTDDPTDKLEHHQKTAKDKWQVKVLPTFRPDKGMMIDNPAVFKPWFEKLQAAADTAISSYSQYIEAIKKRHDYFHANGCRLSDHGLETAYAETYSDDEIEKIFQSALSGKEITVEQALKFKSAVLYECGLMNHGKGWVQQFHLGPMRNNNARMFRALGPDTGFDSIGDFEQGRPLAKLLSNLNDSDRLAKTIIYNINPADNDLFAAMTGNFQDGKTKGKMQFGSGWWFLDQKDGIEKQLSSLSNMGLLSQFVGMLTDSRSFVSYPRHDYFRRVLCNLIGNDIENGMIPDEPGLYKPMIENICYNNAKNYFDFGIE